MGREGGREANILAYVKGIHFTIHAVFEKKNVTTFCIYVQLTFVAL